MLTWSLGVDLGTSYCVGAFAAGDKVSVLDVAGERRVPSTVLLTPDGNLLAGTPATRSMRRWPDHAERNPKRYVGRTSPMLLGGTPVPVTDALEAQLRLFVAEGRRYFDGTDPQVLVLTHPAAWAADQLALLGDVARRVLPEVGHRFVPEPVAAAWYYASDRALRPGEVVGVYDLGGGTFDVAALQVADDGFEVLGSDGDQDIGGENFDSEVYALFGAQLAVTAPDWWERVATGTDSRSLLDGTDLLQGARQVKEALSEFPDAGHYVEGADVDVRVTCAEFEAVVVADVDRTRGLLQDVLTRSSLTAGHLSGIYLTGGASRIPLVARTLRPVYGDLVRTWQNPKAAVALGAVTAVARSAPPEPPPPRPPDPPPSQPIGPFRGSNGAPGPWGPPPGLPEQDAWRRTPVRPPAGLPD